MAHDSESGDADTASVDPIEFLRRALHISPQDAAQVREDAAKRTAGDEYTERAQASTEDTDRP